MKTHHSEIKKDPLYQEALYKVYKNNPELIESQQKSNAEKKQRLNAIKINKICMAFSNSICVVYGFNRDITQ